MRYLIFIVAGILAACAQAPQPSDQIVNYETKGNLQGTAPLRCVGLEAVSNQRTPADIYPGVAQCVSAGEYDKASQLFALAGVYGRFDMLRVSDSTARQAVRVLQINSFGSFSKDQRDALKTAMLKYTQAGSKQFASLCSKIKSIGAPNYQPTYMIQHGMGAFLGGSGSGVNPNFDAVQGWRDSLNDYLHCPY